ncbi:unnamed protein product [Effrenium voratum]|nr:unnamed protein product [Effrenium voratum]
MAVPDLDVSSRNVKLTAPPMEPPLLTIRASCPDLGLDYALTVPVEEPSNVDKPVAFYTAAVAERPPRKHRAHRCARSSSQYFSRT